MKVWNRVLMHLLSGALIIGSFQAAVLPLEAQQAGPTSSAGASTDEQARLESLPDSPGVARSSEQGQSQSQGTSSSQSSSNTAQPPQSESQSHSQPQTASPPQKPVGTAAAETSNGSGVAASQPAGVAIAPAKQRRVRTIVLRVGALAAAGVAVGTVAALSRGTASKPPGAH